MLNLPLSSHHSITSSARASSTMLAYARAAALRLSALADPEGPYGLQA
jgi:hypothetical protein